MGTFLLGGFRFAYEAVDLADAGFHTHLQQVLVDTLAKDINDALTKAACAEVEHFGSVAVEGECDIRIDQCDTFESRQDIVEFRSIRLQEFTTGRNIEEQVLNDEVTAFGTRTRLLTDKTAASNGQVGTDILVPTPRFQFYLRHSSNRCQRLPAKPIV